MVFDRIGHYAVFAILPTLARMDVALPLAMVEKKVARRWLTDGTGLIENRRGRGGRCDSLSLASIRFFRFHEVDRHPGTTVPYRVLINSLRASGAQNFQGPWSFVTDEYHRLLRVAQRVPYASRFDHSNRRRSI